jgi:hypothetical protein
MHLKHSAASLTKRSKWLHLFYELHEKCKNGRPDVTRNIFFLTIQPYTRTVKIKNHISACGVVLLQPIPVGYLKKIMKGKPVLAKFSIKI